jgi:hypothetical protein
MITLLLAATLSVVMDPSFADSTQAYYAQQNAAALENLLRKADTRFEDLLCRYRLYPLTEDEALLDGLPEHVEDGSARELALLSGLWGYRAARASIFSAIRYGRRAERLLDDAVALDADDPFVLLIEGQSLIFKPAIAGRDEESALARFNRLHDVLQATPADTGVSLMEAQLWRWYALHQLDMDNAPAVRDELLAADPPPLYRQFLQDPP